jgi:hypothetical protein
VFYSDKEWFSLESDCLSLPMISIGCSPVILKLLTSSAVTLVRIWIERFNVDNQVLMPAHTEAVSAQDTLILSPELFGGH